MIYSLRRKFILSSMVSILIVLTLIFTVMFIGSRLQLNRAMDELTDAIASNDGIFPRFEEIARPLPRGAFPHMEVITEETPFSTRFFTVQLDSQNRTISVNTDSISSISESDAREYAKTALKKGTQRGWISDYRYIVFHTSTGKAIVFVNGAMNRMMINRFLAVSFLILAGSGFVILILIIFSSKQAVRPAAESYEKQKQFITDASHELKTPLTLILSNLDIVESEIGENEWLSDIRSEGERMRMLINQLVVLSRMDEDQSNISVLPFDLSEAVLDTVSEFEPLAAEREKTLEKEIEPGIVYKGDECLIRRLAAILLDNAVKYCDPGGKIKVFAYRRRHPVIIVENTYCDVDRLELDKLCDRFYRGDKARSFSGSFGVGLSIAKAIAKNHHGDITIYKRACVIGIKAELK